MLTIKIAKIRSFLENKAHESIKFGEKSLFLAIQNIFITNFARQIWVKISGYLSFPVVWLPDKRAFNTMTMYNKITLAHSLTENFNVTFSQ